MNDMMHRMTDPGRWGVTTVVVWIVMLAAVIVIFLVAYKLFASPRDAGDGGRRQSAASESSDALEVLDLRYARGDIERHEYEEWRRTIEAGRS